MKAIACSRKHALINDIAFILSFTVLMIISAYIRIPLFFTPVPITMQTFVLFLSVLFLGRKACFSHILYVALGMGGLPVFCKGGAGFLYLLGPTGGYIVSFIVVAFIFPFLVNRENSFLKNFAAFILANVVIHSLGVSWLVAFHKFSLGAALAAGTIPFIIGDIFKAVLAASFSFKK
jgi:biotin transport system substrate-specific component